MTCTPEELEEYHQLIRKRRDQVEQYMIKVKIPMSDQGGKEGFGMTRKRTMPTKPHHMGGIKKTKRKLAQDMKNVSSVKLPTTTQDEPLKDLTLTVIVSNNSPVLSLTQDL